MFPEKIDREMLIDFRDLKAKHVEYSLANYRSRCFILDGNRCTWDSQMRVC